ncbi:MAG TPA: FmdB family transcriptional regulator [Ilumatobacteraceae bacterium]|nr:FmdB family transcriptional regulator [Ilumatobacteraceae bacterium]
MPTYVYKFIDTGETIEVQQAFTDDTLTELANPRTGETMAVRKVFLPVGVTFKGGGFYKTDSRGGKSSTTKSDSTSTSSDSSPGSTGSGSDSSSSSGSSSSSSSTSSSSTGSSTSTSAAAGSSSSNSSASSS